MNDKIQEQIAAIIQKLTDNTAPAYNVFVNEYIGIHIVDAVIYLLTIIIGCISIKYISKKIKTLKEEDALMCAQASRTIIIFVMLMFSISLKDALKHAVAPNYYFVKDIISK